MTVIEVEDPETGQITRLAPRTRNGRTHLVPLKESIHDESKMTPLELEARAAFAEGASRAFGMKAVDGESPAWAPVREKMAEVAKLPDERKSQQAEDRARQQELIRAMVPEDVLRAAEGLAPLKVRTKIKTRKRSTRPAVEPAQAKPVGGLETIPKPPFWY
jgi:hypothetical protein